MKNYYYSDDFKKRLIEKFILKEKFGKNEEKVFFPRTEYKNASDLLKSSGIDVLSTLKLEKSSFLRNNEKYNVSRAAKILVNKIKSLSISIIEGFVMPQKEPIHRPTQRNLFNLFNTKIKSRDKNSVFLVTEEKILNIVNKLNHVYVIENEDVPRFTKLEDFYNEFLIERDISEDQQNESLIIN